MISARGPPVLTSYTLFNKEFLSTSYIYDYIHSRYYKGMIEVSFGPRFNYRDS